jgi:hypothetical protein
MCELIEIQTENFKFFGNFQHSSSKTFFYQDSQKTATLENKLANME